MRRILGNKDVAALLHEKRAGMFVRYVYKPDAVAGEITSELNKGRCRELLQNFISRCWKMKNCWPS